MKFNIYDSSTWNPQCSCSSTNSITSKAIGSIGQKIQQVRELKDFLEAPGYYTTFEERAYFFLKKHNRAAITNYDLSVESSSQKAGEIIRKCNTILSIWSRREERTNTWKTIATLLSEIKQYLGLDKKSLKQYSLLRGTLSITGNAGWEAYCNLFSLLENNGWNPPDSIEDDIEDEEDIFKI